VIPDAPVVGARDGAKFGPAIVRLEQLHLFAAMREQAVLHIDAGKGCGERAQIGRRRPHQARELPERPVGRRDRRVVTRRDQREHFRILTARLDTDRPALDDPRCCLIGPAAHAGVKVGEREIAFVVRAREPFG